ncbi:MAG: hypothetical protein BYD32DRAFT_159732 [Podila humilis]|nr:MAG: hypothetical protein BYD32DRAFT_159732 [Podila humilis]
MLLAFFNSSYYQLSPVLQLVSFATPLLPTFSAPIQYYATWSAVVSHSRLHLCGGQAIRSRDRYRQNLCSSPAKLIPDPGWQPRSCSDGICWPWSRSTVLHKPLLQT